MTENTLVLFQHQKTPESSALYKELAKHVTLIVISFDPKDKKKQATPYKVQYIPTTLALFSRTKLKLARTRDKTTIASIIPEHARVIFLDTDATNSLMRSLLSAIAQRIPRANRLLWVAQTNSKRQERWLTQASRKISTWLLAQQVDTVISSSEVTTAYLTALGLPLNGQELIRTFYALYTQSEIAAFLTTNVQKTNDLTTFGFLGEFSEENGVPELLQAIALYKEQNTRFIFAGSGTLSSKIAERARKDPRISSESLPHTEEEKSEFFATLDYLVYPAKYDPWGMCVVEAASRGVPTFTAPNVGAHEFAALCDTELVLTNTQPIAIAKAVAEASKWKHSVKRYAQIHEKTKKIAQLWTAEKAAEAFM